MDGNSFRDDEIIKNLLEQGIYAPNFNASLPSKQMEPEESIKPWEGSVGMQPPSEMQPDGPSLFQRASNQIDKQEAAGNVSPSLTDLTRKLASSPSAPASPVAHQSTGSTTNDYLKTLMGDTSSDDELKDANAKRDYIRLLTGLGKAGETIGAGFAKIKNPDHSVLEGIEKNADQSVQDVLLKRKQKSEMLDTKSKAQKLASDQELEDPNSPTSKLTRDMLGKLGYKYAENVSAGQLKRAGIDVDKMINVYETAQARKDAMKIHEQDRKDKLNDTLVSHLKDDLDPNRARGGNLAFNQKKIDQAERLEGLITDAGGNINNLDSRQIEELAIGLNSMLSNANTSAVSQVQALVPKTIIGNTQKLKEWLINEPQGTNQIAFVKRMADTIQREKEIAQGQVKKAQAQRLSAYDKLKKESPERYNALLNSYGFGAEDFDEKGQYKPKERQNKSNNSNKPKTVIQNGHTYTLNESTGKYE